MRDSLRLVAIDDAVSSSRPPSVDALLRDGALAAVIRQHGASSVTSALRVAIDETRAAWLAGSAIGEGDLIARALASLEQRDIPHARRVFNLSGTTLHTNLGRAPLSERAIAAAVEAMRHPLALEYDLASGGRGDRDDLVEELVCELTGAEAATVVNNNAAAVLLALDALGGMGGRNRGKRAHEAIVSRGELVEIGGSFRIPDIMRRAGCKLVEVGTTNRTHVKDYRDAITDKTALLMKVHASNYRIEGFIAMPHEAEIAAVAREAGVPFMVDLGAGALIDLSAHGLPHEPTVRETLAAGADIVTFSGDKLLGGPQAGLIVGKRDLIARMKKSPLKRCLRCDKATLAALEATLMLYREPEHLAERLTTLRWLTRSRESIKAMALRLRPAFAAKLSAIASVEVDDCLSQIGSGAQPVDLLPSAALVIRPAKVKGGGRVLANIEAALRSLPIPIVARINKGALWMDLRTVEDEDALLASWAHFVLKAA
jgi:L-seryl-tRNA(Ser) seleniumtransferase